MYSNPKATSKDDSVSSEIEHFVEIDNLWMSEIHQLRDGVTVQMFVITRVDSPIYQNDTFKMTDLELIKILGETFNGSMVIPFLFKTVTLTHREGVSTVGAITKTFHKNNDGPVSGLTYFLKEISDSQNQFAHDRDNSRVFVIVGEPTCKKKTRLDETPLIISKASFPSDVQLAALRADIVSSIRNLCICSHIDDVRIEPIDDEIIEISIKVVNEEVHEYQININIEYMSEAYSRANILEISRRTVLQEIYR